MCGALFSSGSFPYLPEYYQSIKMSDLCKHFLDVPQSPVLDPSLFALYTKLLSLTIGKQKDIKFSFNAGVTVGVVQ